MGSRLAWWRQARALVAALALLSLGLPGQAGGERSASGQALRVRVRDVIGWTQVALVQRALRAADAGEATLIVLDLDTPGGRLDATRELITLLQNLRRRQGRVQLVAFVNPQAWSAGALIALATGRIYFTETGTLGDAYPIQVDPLGQPREIPEGLREKELSALRAQVRDLARAFPPERQEAVALLGEAMVDPSLEVRKVQVRDASGVTRTRLLTRQMEDLELEKGNQVTPLAVVCEPGKLLTLTAAQAVELGLAEGIVADWAGLLQLFGLGAEAVREVELTATERFVDLLESWSFLLLLVGLVAGLIAFKVPGFGVPEVVALLCFFLLFLAHYHTGLSGWVEPVLFLAGVALLAVELFVMPGTIVVGLLGGLLAAVALVLSFQSFLWPENEWEALVFQDNLLGFVGTALGVIVAGVLLSRFLPGIPLLRRAILESPGGTGSLTAQAEDPGLRDRAAGLLGRQGTALTPLRPAGKARFGGEPLDVQTEGEFLELGTPVVILRCDSNRIVVKAAAGGTDPS